MLAERKRTGTDIDREAAEWLARHEMTRLTPAEAEAFETWRAADPRHAEAFEAVSRTLADVASLSSLAELEPLEPERPAWRGRAAFGAIAATLAAVLVAPALLDRPDIEASTLVAEIRPITLPDGTKVTLGASSEIRADFTDGERRVRLVRGEAFFEVADNARPFVVDAGGTEIRDIGTSFDVKRGAGKVEVGVLDGVVEVRPNGVLGRGPVVRRLEAGQRVRARDAGLGPIVTSARVGAVEIAPAAAGAWREGQLAYDDAPLADVVADLNRYSRPGVRLEAGAAGEARLAASFKADEIDKFLAELPAVAPVTVTRGEDGAILISPRNG